MLALTADGSAFTSSVLTSAGSQSSGDFVEGLSLFVERAALILASILIVVAILILAIAMWKRMRVASLVVRPFVDSAVDIKVGPGVSSLVEERLMGALRRKAHEEDAYDLDQVAIDIELLAGDNDLSKAITQLVDVPQLKLVGALMGLVERMLPSRGLAVTGELLPAGSEGIGVGVALALYKGSRLAARSALWESEVKLWLPGAAPAREEKKRPKKASTQGHDVHDPSPHYGLSAAAAWWVQYEAAQAFDANVSLVTKSAPSFSLVGVALAQERKCEPEEAADSYAKALALDPDNVAALFNLALLLARRHRLHAPAALLLVRAEKALEDRHRSQKRSSPESELRDPTWYRIRYALGVQCLQLAVSGAKSKNGKNGGKERGRDGWDAGKGWPRGLAPGSEKNANWNGCDFGPALRKLLAALAEDANALPRETPTELATRRAGELLLQTGEVLDKDGWRWVGRRRPRYRRDADWLRGGLGRHIPSKWRERPVASDRKLTQFLNEVVEPAAVVLYCATIAQEDGEYERFRATILDPLVTSPVRLDRRELSRRKTTKRDWARAYLSILLAESPAPDGSSAPMVAYLRRRKGGRVQVRMDPRANYSFACMLSRLANEAPVEKDRASFAAVAALKLESALSRSPSGRRGRLAEWARDDPDLAALRDPDPAAFDAIIAPWGPAERRALQHLPVDSPKISVVAYQDAAEILELQFSDGSRRQFLGVPKDLVKQLEADPDPDRFVAEEVEPSFTSVRA